MNKDKCYVFLESILLIIVIILAWLVMFIPVMVYFLPLTVAEGINGSLTIFGMTSMYECQNNETDVNSTALVCDDGFYRDGELCLPSCHVWRTFHQSEETTSLAFIGTATIIGIITTIVIITLSFSVPYFKKTMLKLPSVLILYQDITVSVFGALILIGFMDRRLFCVSDNLIKSYTSSSHFCTFSGIMSSYAVLPLTIWIAVQVGYMFCAISAPFYFKQLKEKKRTLAAIHVLSLIVGVLAPLIPSIAALASGGFTVLDTKFPPFLCFARNRDVTMYSLVIPLTVIISTIITLLILIFHRLIRHRCFKQSKSVIFQSAEVKVLVISCCYVVVGLGAPLAYIVSSVFLRGLQKALSEYFECNLCGLECDKSHYEQFLNPPLITIGYSLLVLYPVITLIYFIRFTSVKNCITKYLPITSTSDNSTNN